MLLPAVVLADPLFSQNLTTVALDVPEAVAPLVDVSLHTTESMREPSAPAVKARTIAVPVA
jgi:hypothetical protein